MESGPLGFPGVEERVGLLQVGATAFDEQVTVFARAASARRAIGDHCRPELPASYFRPIPVNDSLGGVVQLIGVDASCQPVELAGLDAIGERRRRRRVGEHDGHKDPLPPTSPKESRFYVLLAGRSGF